MACSDMGEPVTIFEVTSDGIELDTQALESILLETEAENLPIAVVAIAGKLRTGKSFILNFLREYLASEDKNDWLSSPDACIEGFPWKAGPDGHTDGIVMWSKPFVVQRSDGQKVAVLLMDTQGLFDTRANINDSVTFYTLSTLLSSLQIFNTSRDIEMDQLERIQMFINFTKDVDNTKLQSLLFLVRDWRHKKRYNFGFDGGMEYLASIWCKAGENKSLENIHADIMDVYQQIECFLMPYPGQLVDNDDEYSGNVGDVDEVFMDMAWELTDILHADRIPIKTIEGRTITGTKLFEVVSAYAKHFRSGKMPEAKTIYESHLSVWKMSVQEEVYAKYETGMKSVMNAIPMDEADLETTFNLYKWEAMQYFDDQYSCKDIDGWRERFTIEEKMHRHKKDLLDHNRHALFEKKTKEYVGYGFAVVVGLAARYFLRR